MTLQHRLSPSCNHPASWVCQNCIWIKSASLDELGEQFAITEQMRRQAKSDIDEITGLQSLYPNSRHSWERCGNGYRCKHCHAVSNISSPHLGLTCTGSFGKKVSDAERKMLDDITRDLGAIRVKSEALKPRDFGYFGHEVHERLDACCRCGLTMTEFTNAQEPIKCEPDKRWQEYKAAKHEPVKPPSKVSPGLPDPTYRKEMHTLGRAMSLDLHPEMAERIAPWRQPL